MNAYPNLPPKEPPEKTRATEAEKLHAAAKLEVVKALKSLNMFCSGLTIYECEGHENYDLKFRTEIETFRSQLVAMKERL